MPSLFRLEIDQKFDWVDTTKKIVNEDTIRREYFLGFRIRNNHVKVTHNVDNVDETRGRIGLLQDR